MSPLFLPLLCPMGPRDILELDLLQTQLEPGELCLVLRDPPSLDRPESSRRRCELGGDRVVSHPRGRMRCRCAEGALVSLGREGDRGAAAQSHEIGAHTELNRRGGRNDDAEGVPPLD